MRLIPGLLAAACAVAPAVPATAATTATTGTTSASTTTTAATSPEPIVPVPATGSVAVIGKGYGHGRGMSQFGAANAATQGLTWQQITGFYYPGATPTTLPATTTIRTGLVDSIGTGVRVTAADGLTATDGKVTRTLPTTDTVNGVTSPVVRWEITLPTGGEPGTVLTFVTASGRRAPLALSAGTWTIASPTGTLRVVSTTGTTSTYLGSLRGVRRGTTISPVLVSRLDDYLRMVVPNESYASWPVQALAAQAVAARTYAAAALRSPRSADFDICSTTACQVVGSLTAESAGSRQGVALTAGTVLTTGGMPINAEFGSTNGGWTASGGVSYLPAQADPYDRSTLNPLGSWSARVPVSALAAAYPAVGRVTGIQVLRRDGRGAFGGRVLSAKVIGTSGKVTTTGDALRRALGLLTVKSTFLAVVPAASRPTPVQRTASPLLALAAGTLTATTPASTVGPPGPVRLATDAGEWDAAAGSDVLGVATNGSLRLYHRTPTGLDAGRTVAAGFGDATAILTVNDLNGDGQRDLLVRRGDGRLERFTADGVGGLVPGPGITVATGLGAARSLAAADVDGDGRDDVVALAADGSVTAYRSTGRDVLRTPMVIGRLPGMRAIGGRGDLTGDGRADLVGIDGTGATWTAPLTPAGLGAATRVGRVAGGTAIL